MALVNVTWVCSLYSVGSRTTPEENVIVATSGTQKTVKSGENIS